MTATYAAASNSCAVYGLPSTNSKVRIFQKLASVRLMLEKILCPLTYEVPPEVSE
jgi:hypothetical protein